jgi:hypothetical protein
VQYKKSTWLAIWKRKPARHPEVPGTWQVTWAGVCCNKNLLEVPSKDEGEPLRFKARGIG